VRAAVFAQPGRSRPVGSRSVRSGLAGRGRDAAYGHAYLHSGELPMGEPRERCGAGVRVGRSVPGHPLDAGAEVPAGVGDRCHRGGDGPTPWRARAQRLGLDGAREREPASVFSRCGRSCSASPCVRRRLCV
jgi:hypothetical protein